MTVGLLTQEAEALRDELGEARRLLAESENRAALLQARVAELERAAEEREPCAVCARAPRVGTGLVCGACR